MQEAQVTNESIEAAERQRYGQSGEKRFILIRWLNFMRRYPVISIGILVLLLFAGIFAPLIMPQDPNFATLRARNAPGFWDQGWYDENPNVEKFYFLGADPQGRDVLSRIIDGARISLLVAGVALAAGITIGVTLGLLAGYYGGMIDEIISRIWDVWASIPFLLIALIIATVVGNSLWTVMGLLAMLSWSAFVRNVRAEVLTLKERDYVYQARIVGSGPIHIFRRHILPNVINTVVVIATLRVGGLILAEASLSFLGVGIPKPQATWGNMIADGNQYLRDAWWISIVPGIAIFMVVMALNFLGDWLRDRWDPRLRQL